MESSFFKDDESNKEAWVFGKNIPNSNNTSEFGLGFSLNSSSKQKR